MTRESGADSRREFLELASNFRLTCGFGLNRRLKLVESVCGQRAGNLCRYRRIGANGPEVFFLVMRFHNYMAIRHQCDGASDLSVTPRDIPMRRKDCDPASSLAHPVLKFPLFCGHDHDAS